MSLASILSDDPQQFETALALSKDLKLTASNLELVGNKTSVELARAAFAQWDLRARAKAKFAQAESMLFIREALEQASGDLASRYHASLFPQGVDVADLTTGIGGDLIEIAKRGPVIAFELDSERAVLARWNLSSLGLTGSVVEGDGLAWLGDERDRWIFADPARRVGGRRTNALEEFTPDPVKISEFGRDQELCIQKLSPFLSDSNLETLGDRVEFISAGGECKEALAICGKQSGRGRIAVHVESGRKLKAGPPTEFVTSPAEFFFDVDPAAVRAHCLGTLCEQHGLRALADSNGYLTGHTQVSSIWLRTYRTLHEGPGDLKSTKKKLAELGSSTPILKQRSTGLDLEKMRSALKLSGPRQLLVACYLRESRVRHAILETI